MTKSTRLSSLRAAVWNTTAWLLAPAGARLLTALCLATGAAALAFGQSAIPPASFRDLYVSHQQKLEAFDRKVTAQWNGQKSPVLWGAELLMANCNRGRALLEPAAREGILEEIAGLQALGVKAVTVCIGFPILYEPFYRFNGDPEDYARFIKFYRELAAEIHRRGLKLIVESSVLFPGSYSRESGFKLAAYYRTLTGRQLADGRARNVVAIAREARPDFLNTGSEPDTQGKITGKLFLQDPGLYADMIAYFVRQLRQAGLSDIPIGAGIGTWQPRGEAYLKALLATGIDYLDLHVYAINRNYLDNAITYADMAQAAGKKVAMSEAWLLKTRDSELGGVSTTSDPSTFARDVYSFWAPLDQRFLGALIKYAYWKHLLYFSPFWSRYFWSYVDHEGAGDRGNADQVLQEATIAARAAMRRKGLSSTGEFYRDAIAGAARK